MENSSVTNKTADEGHGAVRTVKVGGLAGRMSGTFDGRPPLVLLHGLSFDRTMWNPALDILLELDPARQFLALDLPGHGHSDTAPAYDIESVVGIVFGAVEEAGLIEPVMVGHSLSAIVVTVYASLHPVRGVLNVDQSLQTAGFGTLLHSLSEKLMGPGFMDVWKGFEASFHTELLPPGAQKLLRSSSHPTQELVTGYWREVMDTSPEVMAARFENVCAELRDRPVPYLVIAGSEPEPAYRRWLAERIPQAGFDVFPAAGHFPQLADPARFAALLSATAPAGP